MSWREASLLLREALRKSLKERRVRLRDVDRKLGWGRNNYTSQLLRGSPDLKVDQLYAILEAAGIAPRDFFSALHPPEEGTALLGEVEAALRRLGYEPQSHAEEGAAPLATETKVQRGKG